MLDPKLVARLPHVSRLSISDQLKKGAMRRREFRIPTVLLPDDMGYVQISGGSDKIPAAVAAKCLLAKQQLAPDKSYVQDQWQLVLEPYDKNLLKRSHTKGRKLTAFDVVPALGLGEVMPASSDITKIMQDAHRSLSDLRPPYEGTMFMVVFWQTRNGVAAHDFVISSLNGVRRYTKRARQHNRLVKASCTPFGKPIDLFGFRVWGKGNFRDAPEVPERDEWVHANEAQIRNLITHHFKPALWSLWRAVFAEPPVAERLVEQGYMLGESDRTCLGSEDLRELIQKRGQQRGNFTVLGTPQLLDELSEEHLEDLSEMD